eukprot:CAMPEP_0185274492 /NCGR_PEP_ID=MMETSP1359-20130426/51968_1 /TAXON_ID=552665 /ORGANISM="Bigelowiella longifila, Strain CCMP242" /LENGTH=198 /DNA_ID=CAMNT_0027867485 /DNA_START=170 /DNA_END=767 /DNA_ORIENTATION=-
MRVLDGDFMLNNRTTSVKSKRQEGSDHGDEESNHQLLKRQRQRRLQGSGLFGYKPRKKTIAPAPAPAATGSEEGATIISDDIVEEDKNKDDEGEDGNNDVNDVDTSATGLFRYKPKDEKNTAKNGVGCRDANDLKTNVKKGNGSLTSAVTTSNMRKDEEKPEHVLKKEEVSALLTSLQAEDKRDSTINVLNTNTKADV